MMVYNYLVLLIHDHRAMSARTTASIVVVLVALVVGGISSSYLHTIYTAIFDNDIYYLLSSSITFYTIYSLKLI